MLFPSHVPHKVYPVASGLRQSLVLWMRTRDADPARTERHHQSMLRMAHVSYTLILNAFVREAGGVLHRTKAVTYALEERGRGSYLVGNLEASLTDWTILARLRPSKNSFSYQACPTLPHPATPPLTTRMHAPSLRPATLTLAATHDRHPGRCAWHAEALG